MGPRGRIAPLDMFPNQRARETPNRRDLQNEFGPESDITGSGHVQSSWLILFELEYESHLQPGRLAVECTLSGFSLMMADRLHLGRMRRVTIA